MNIEGKSCHSIVLPSQSCWLLICKQRFDYKYRIASYGTQMHILILAFDNVYSSIPERMA